MWEIENTKEYRVVFNTTQINNKGDGECTLERVATINHILQFELLNKQDDVANNNLKGLIYPFCRKRGGIYFYCR